MHRLTCCVPFCRHTTKRVEFLEWICGDHWRLIDKTKRQVYGRIAREWRRYKVRPYTADATVDYRSMVNRIDRIWGSLKREAIERGAGL